MLLEFMQRQLTIWSKICSPLNATQQTIHVRPAGNLRATHQGGTKLHEIVYESVDIAPHLGVAGNSGRITLDTNDYDPKICCTLLQQQPDKTTKPVRYWLRLLTDARCKYDMTQREDIAMVWSVKLLRPYFEETQHTIQMYQNKLKQIHSLTNFTGRLANLRMKFFELDSSNLRSTLTKRAEVKYQAADAHSRLPTKSEN